MIPVQKMPAVTTPVAIMALDPNTDYPHGFTLTIANVTGAAHSWTWYFDPDGATYADSTKLGPTVAIAANTMVIVEWPTRIGIGCNGSFGVQADAASVLNFTIGERGT